MRFRSIGSLTALSSEFRNAGLRRVVHHDGSPDSYPDPPFDVLSEFAEQSKSGKLQTMWDSFSTRRPWNDHPCIHEIEEWKWVDTDQIRNPKSFQIGAEHGSADPSEWTELWCDWDCHAGRGFWISPTPVNPAQIPINPTLPALTGNAAKVMEDHIYNVITPIRQSISLANFLLEIDDIKHSFETVWELAHKLNPSNQILNYQLGIKPLVGDLKGLTGLIGNLYRDISELRRSQNHPIRITTYRDISDPSQASSHVHPTESDDTISVFGYDTLADVVTVKFVTWVRYDLSHLSDIALTCKAALHSIGIGNPLQIYWNAVPYTFMIDWLINISAMLRKFSLETELPRSIIRQTSHLKIERSHRLYSSVFDGPHSDRPIFDDVKVGEVYRKYYRRWVGLPRDWEPTNYRDPSLREQVLSVLLGAQAAKSPNSRSLVDFAQLDYKKLKKKIKNRSSRRKS